MVMFIIALAAASVGQQQPTPKPADESRSQSANVVTINPSEVTPVPQSVQKGAVLKSRAKASTALDMRPAAVCAREMNDEYQKSEANENYLAEMGHPQLVDLKNRALNCIPLLQPGITLRKTALILGEARWYEGFYSGWDAATKQANEAQAASKTVVCVREIREKIQNIQRVNATTEMGSKDFARMGKSQLEDLEKQAYDCLMQSETTQLAAFILDQSTWYQAYDAALDQGWIKYKALVSDYNSLVNQYNTLLGVANNLASRPTVITVPSFMPPPPPQELHLNCTAMALPGNMATVNCW